MNIFSSKNSLDKKLKIRAFSEACKLTCIIDAYINYFFYVSFL